MISLHLHTPRGIRFSRLSVVPLVLLLSICSLTRAQEPEDVIRVRTDLVAVPVVVTDQRGRRVPGLKAEDFALTDDAKPARIDYFASGTERVAILFAIDTSGSTREIVAQQRAAAVALFSRFGHGSRVAVLQFSDLVRLPVPFTSDSAAVEVGFSFEASASRGTAIFDGAATAIRSFDGRGGFSMERRIVILISDGLDTISSTSYSKVVEAARGRGVSFYVIHFLLFTPRDGALAPRPPSKGFRELADQTGGRYFRIGDAKSALSPHPQYDLTPVFQAIDDDLRGQYVVGFYPGESARDNRFHEVNLVLAPRNKRRLRLQQLLTGYELKP